MFLHSGAGLHGHEYSHEHRTSSLSRGSSLTRSAFSNSLARRASTYDKPSPILHLPTAQVRPASEYIPRLSEPVVRFQEPETETMSDDGKSVAASEVSGTTAGGSRRRRWSTRTSTAFHLALPAPTLTQKQRLLEIRPRILLQLQRLSAETRPKPAVDVLPSAVVVPRLVKKFPRIFRGKAKLGANDVMVVKSEEYDTSDDHAVEDTDSDEEGLANRDLLAVICQVRKDYGGSQGRAEIVLSDGSVWLATPLPNGLYEFVTTDERGNKITARWVRRMPRRQTNVDLTIANDFKFTFSIIDPNSRRHPIMASITNNTLDIPDSYTSVSSSASKYPPPSYARDLLDDAQNQPVDEPHPERTTHIIDEQMKTLIQVTGIWVALRQGLSPYFKYNDAMASDADSSPMQRDGSIGCRVRSLTVRTDSGRASPTGTTLNTPESVHSMFGSKIRQKGANGSPASMPSTPLDHGGLPKRVVSSGSAFMQRQQAAARRISNLPSTVTSDSEGEGTFSPPRRVVTENLIASFPKQNHSSQHPPLPILLPTPADTPTKQPQGRMQAVYMPFSEQDTGVMKENFAKYNAEVIGGQETADSSRRCIISRWKDIKDFFRRSPSATRRG